MVGFVGGVDTVRGGAVRYAAVHLSVGLAAASLTPGQLGEMEDFWSYWSGGIHCSVPRAAWRSEDATVQTGLRLSLLNVKQKEEAHNSCSSLAAHV